VAVRAKEGLYNGFQGYRPIFFDANALFVPRISAKASGEIMAGVGGVRTLFYDHSGSYGSGSCNPIYGNGCLTYLNNIHFLAHIGGGVRYDVWRKLFIRPEAHLYLIPNNTPFHSDYVGRLGVSVGYRFEPR
jgi:hypothetical protein